MPRSEARSTKSEGTLPKARSTRRLTFSPDPRVTRATAQRADADHRSDLVSSDRFTRIEARLDRIESLLKIVRGLLTEDPTSSSAYPDQNLGAH